MKFDKIVKNIINEELEYYSSSKTKKPRQPSWKEKHKRVPFYVNLKDDYDCYMEKEVQVEVPFGAFPLEVIEKYKRAFNLTNEDIEKYGVLPDVNITLDYSVSDGDLSLDGDTFWQMMDEEQEDIYTAHSPEDQFKMNLAIEEGLDKYIRNNKRYLEKLIEDDLRD